MANEGSEKKNQRRKLIFWLLMAFVVVLAGLLIWLFQKQKDTEAEKQQNYEQMLDLQSELDSLLTAHSLVKEEYGVLADELLMKDSLINAKADSIRFLLRRQANYYQIRHELDILREESSMYMAHIDSLYRVTQILEAENKEIRSQYQAEQIRSAQLFEEREYFAEKVAVGSILKATNVKANAYRVKSGTIKLTDKARRADRLEVCFTIQENLVVESGKRDVFMRITRPDGQVITRDASHKFVFNGETIPYSVKQQIRYVNKAQTICMKWDKVDPEAEAMPGTYSIVLIIDDYVVGQTQITLK